MDSPAKNGCRPAPARIVVVDDEAVARQNLGHALGKEGHIVRLARDGRQALDLLAEEPAEVVVSDLRMERVDGQALLAAVRERHPGTAFILVTGYATVDSALAAMKDGAVHYLAKPLDLDEVRRAVREILALRALRAGLAAPCPLQSETERA